MRAQRHVCLLLLLILAASAFWGCGHSKSGVAENASAARPSNEIAVKIAAVRRLEWVSRIGVSGNLRSRSMVDIKPEVGGRLIAVHFQEGDAVRKDQLLAELDPANYALAYNQAAAALAVAEAGLERARVAAEHAATEKARAENLLRSGGITEKDHQASVTGVREAGTQVRLAEAQCAQARAALAIASKALEDCRILAPASGHVQKRFFDRGALLSPGSSLYTLVDNSRLELECDVPSHQLAAIRIGQKAVFTTPTWGERTFDGSVSAINPAVDADNRSVKVILKIDNPGGDLRSGMYARGEIIAGTESRALVIPRDALLPERESERDAAVYVVRDGRAREQRVHLGGLTEDLAWVRQGLDEGDAVVAEIGPGLKDGVSIRPLR